MAPMSDGGWYCGLRQEVLLDSKPEEPDADFDDLLQPTEVVDAPAPPDAACEGGQSHCGALRERAQHTCAHVHASTRMHTRGITRTDAPSQAHAHAPCARARMQVRTHGCAVLWFAHHQRARPLLCSLPSLQLPRPAITVICAVGVGFWLIGWPLAPQLPRRRMGHHDGRRSSRIRGTPQHRRIPPSQRPSLSTCSTRSAANLPSSRAPGRLSDPRKRWRSLRRTPS